MGIFKGARVELRYRHPGRVKARGAAGEHKNGGWIRVIKKLSIKFIV